MINNRNRNNPTPPATQKPMISPLQALNHTMLEFDEPPQRALKAAADADDNCKRLYQQLTEKTKYLADEVLSVKFPWRVRVGGIRGFRELLLPAFHSVYGVPYISASSLKGVVLAWARQHQDLDQVNRLLGTLNNGIGCVQFLDAFADAPSLSVDMANPQWHWENDQIKYDPQPHALLSMEQQQLIIGLARTSRGNKNDVITIKGWLEQALATSGLGSRVSSGYGRTVLTASRKDAVKKSYEFQLWTAGMYGATPPSQENQYQGFPEFRPTAVRGMLRYWFRAIALGIYPPQQCKMLEAKLFGTIEPQSKMGSIRIDVKWEEEQAGDRNHPHFYSGTIVLESQDSKHLTLIRKVLELASHLGGIGRGSRRPLHWNNPHPGLRGCHWELKSDKLRLSSRLIIWQTRFLPTVRDAFLAVQSPSDLPGNGTPGTPGNRNQDVLNKNAQIYLVPCQTLWHPEGINNWPRNGTTPEVRGTALTLLYDNRFKGVNQQGQGNANVGGRISNNPDGSTPSYVVIKSNFPEGKSPYQAVTVFGANQSDRAKFVQALPQGSIKVWPLP